ncbi:MAG: hypothetical protein ACHQHM_06140 [Thermoanaerobaculales bacterium]
MPIDLEFVHHGVGVLYLCHDALTGGELSEANERLLASPDQVRGLRFALVDLRRVTSLEATTDELRSFATQDRRIAAYASTGLLVAVVAEELLGYGLTRMWQAFADGIGWETEVFRSGAAAEAWVRVTLKEKFDVELTTESKLLP